MLLYAYKAQQAGKIEVIGLRYGAVVTVAEISSQMGEFKPMLPIGKETMIQRVVRTLRKADVENVVVITGYRP